MNNNECSLCYAEFCTEACEEEGECECKDHDFTVLVGIYDENEDGNICPDEFKAFYDDAVN